MSCELQFSFGSVHFLDISIKNSLARNNVFMACNNSHDAVYSAARIEFEHDAFFSFLSVAPSKRFMDPTPLAADPGICLQRHSHFEFVKST